MSAERAYDPKVPRRHPRTESFTLGVLLRAQRYSDGGLGEAVPGRWVEVAKRLLELGLVAITGTPRTFRITSSGRAELTRLVDLGVEPADGKVERTPRRVR